MWTSLQSALDGFDEASADLIARRDLLRRVDSKYMAPARLVASIVAGLAPAYAAVRVPGGHIAIYRNLYFDTPDLKLFRDHRRGRRVRQKVRIRHYPDRELSFLEVKTRRSELHTEKQRLPLPYGRQELGGDERAFLAARCEVAGELVPVLTIDFRRIGLVAVDSDERATIDLAISMTGDRGDLGLGDVALIEVKQAALSLGTPVMRALRGAGLRARSFSKYATAIAMAGGAAAGNLRPVLRDLDKIKR